jgi:subtilisin family serine protease
MRSRLRFSAILVLSAATCLGGMTGLPPHAGEHTSEGEIPLEDRLLEPGSPAVTHLEHVEVATPAARISSEIRQQIAADGAADALIMLHLPAAATGKTRPERVAEVQQNALKGFAEGNRNGFYRFKMIPALAARLNAAQLARLEASPHVLAVGPNQPGTGALSQSLQLIGADQAHRTGHAGNGVVVAVLDSGIDSDHADFAGALVGEQCFCQGAVLGDVVGCCPNGLEEQVGLGSAEDDHGHGSNVTGVILARGGVDFSSPGLAPAAEVVAIKVLDSANSGYLLDWAKGLDWILANRPDVDLVNMSLQSGATYDSNCDAATTTNQAMGTAITSLKTLNNVTTFAASGNYALVGSTTSPGCLADSVMVGAVYDSAFGSYSGSTCTDSSTAPDQVTCFSNVDDIVDMLAPGCKTVAPIAGNWYTWYCGTSQATPHATGTAALLLEDDPTLTPAEILSRMTSSGVSVFDGRISLSFPRVDTAAAIGDLDDDGVANASDNCPEHYNLGQANGDPDSHGDACDNCPLVSNANQADFDHDGIGDSCDPSPNTFPPETLFVVDPNGGGTIYQLDRGTQTVLNSFPTPEPVVGGGSGLSYSTQRASLFYTNATTGGLPTIYELDPNSGTVLNSFLQTDIDGLNGVSGLGSSSGGLVTLAVDPNGATPELLASPHDGSIWTTGFLMGGDFTNQAAIAANDAPLSSDDHAGWFSYNTTYGVPTPSVGVNQLRLLEFSTGLTMERFLTPTICVLPGPNAILQTSAAGDDLVFGNEIYMGLNDACDTLAGTGDDLAGCIDGGPNAAIDTTVLGDDLIVGSVIQPGPNQACNTVSPGGDDVTGGIRNLTVNGIGATGNLLFTTTSDPAHDTIYVLRASGQPITTPRSGPDILQTWSNPTPSGPMEGIAAGPTDSDFDTHPNDEDCADLDPLTWRIPDPAHTLSIAYDPNTGVASLDWLFPVDPGCNPSILVFDVIRSGDPSDFTTGTVCVESNDGTDTTATDSTALPAGSAFFYFARSENGCGYGSHRPGRFCP